MILSTTALRSVPSLIGTDDSAAPSVAAPVEEAGPLEWLFLRLPGWFDEILLLAVILFMLGGAVLVMVAVAKPWVQAKFPNRGERVREGLLHLGSALVVAGCGLALADRVVVRDQHALLAKLSTATFRERLIEETCSVEVAKQVMQQVARQDFLYLSQETLLRVSDVHRTGEIADPSNYHLVRCTSETKYLVKNVGSKRRDFVVVQRLSDTEEDASPRLRSIRFSIDKGLSALKLGVAASVDSPGAAKVRELAEQFHDTGKVTIDETHVGGLRRSAAGSYVMTNSISLTMDAGATVEVQITKEFFEKRNGGDYSISTRFCCERLSLTVEDRTQMQNLSFQGEANHPVAEVPEAVRVNEQSPVKPEYEIDPPEQGRWRRAINVASFPAQGIQVRWEPVVGASQATVPGVDSGTVEAPRVPGAATEQTGTRK